MEGIHARMIAPAAGSESRRKQTAIILGEPGDDQLAMIRISLHTDSAKALVPGRLQGGAAAGERVEHGPTGRGDQGDQPFHERERLHSSSGVSHAPTPHLLKIVADILGDLARLEMLHAINSFGLIVAVYWAYGKGCRGIQGQDHHVHFLRHCRH